MSNIETYTEELDKQGRTLGEMSGKVGQLRRAQSTISRLAADFARAYEKWEAAYKAIPVLTLDILPPTELINLSEDEITALVAKRTAFREASDTFRICAEDAEVAVQAIEAQIPLLEAQLQTQYSEFEPSRKYLIAQIEAERQAQKAPQLEAV